MADGMRLAFVGILPGVLGAYLAARGMSTLLFGVSPGDPATFAGAVGLALVMTFTGSLVPARGARIADVRSQSRVAQRLGWSRISSMMACTVESVEPGAEG